MSNVFGKDFGLEVARGNVPGVTAENKYGRTTNADSGVMTDIHDGADVAGGSNVIWDAPLAARIHQVVSSSTDDDGDPAGVGARTLRVTYLPDWNTVETTVDLTMNGTANVATPACVIIHRMEVLTFGATNVNVGVIKATADTDGTITEQILAGAGQTQMAIYGVSSLQTFYMTEYYGSILKATGGAAIADIIILYNPRADQFLAAAAPFIIKHTIGLESVGSSMIEETFLPPKKFLGPCIIKLQTNTNKADVDISAGFDGYLVTN